MSFMFNECSSLISLDLSNFNCDKIKYTNSMNNMFTIKHKDFKLRGQIIVDLKL